MYLELAHATSLADQRLKRRVCIPCGGMMKLTCIEPDRPGFDRRTFECPICFNVESIEVNIEPMVSGANGWETCNLHAPS